MKGEGVILSVVGRGRGEGGMSVNWEERKGRNGRTNRNQKQDQRAS